MDPGDSLDYHSTSQLPRDEKLLVKWLEDQPSRLHAQLIQEFFVDLLGKLCRPRNGSCDTCNNLCHFLEQCRDSKYPSIRQNAFSEKICLELFMYYLEWNEQNQHRSMHRVLELVSTLISCHPNREMAEITKFSILQRCLSIIGHQSSKPLVKPAFKSLEYFMRKNTVSACQFITAFGTISQSRKLESLTVCSNQDNLWDLFVSEVFDWMSVPDISPVAGKFLVTVFRQTRCSTENMTSAEVRITSWQTWMKRALEKSPYLLENLKNYLLPPLFSLDRSGSLEFLEELNKETATSSFTNEAVDVQALLRLAAFEVGKKTGLMEETATLTFQKVNKKAAKTVILNENLLDPLLAHSSDTVRSLSFSVLVSFASPLRPLSPTAIQTIKSKLHILYSDTEVKFRNEILSTTKQLIERLRGSTAFLVREMSSKNFLLANGQDLIETQKAQVQLLLKQTGDLLQHQKLFIEWWFKFMMEELIPTASYQRHITSLKAINLWIGSGILKQQNHTSRTRQVVPDNKTAWPFAVDIFTPRMIRLLIDLLIDPFEDVRILTASILKFASPFHFTEKVLIASTEVELRIELLKEIGNKSPDVLHLISLGDIRSLYSDIGDPLGILTSFIEHIRKVSDKTGRADYADGLARSYELFYCLQASEKDRLKLLIKLVDELDTKVTLAETNLAQAVQYTPLHGNFAALNLILGCHDIESTFSGVSSINDTQLPQDFLSQIVDICSRTWLIVKPVLCNDSPEGHLPKKLDEEGSIDTKDVLSYSFRAIHESSNLMGTVVRKGQHHHGGPHRLPKDIFTRIGDLSFEKLSALRHRGAFSTVSLTFAACCKSAPYYYQPNSPEETDILDKWLKGAFLCLETQVSTTRRSAGIPSIVTAIMSAMSIADFEKTIRELLMIAKRPIEHPNIDQEQLPQVHALNSLKDILKSVTTSARVNNYISECFEVVGQNLGSPVWAIRNSALILLRSLMDNLIGTSDSKSKSETGWDGKSILIQYEKYPALSRILVQLLHQKNKDLNDCSNENHAVLPALGIIRRAGPPPESRDDLYKLLFELLGSKTWHLREQAAKTISALQEQGDELKTVKMLLAHLGGSTNSHHGAVLAAKFIMLERIETSAYALAQFDDLYLCVLKSILRTYNPFILIEYVEIGNAVLELILAHPDLKTTEERLSHILQFSENYWSPSSSKDVGQHLAKVASYSKSVVPIYFRDYLKQKIHTFILLGNCSAIAKIVEEAQNFGSGLLIAVLDDLVTARKYFMSDETFREILLVLTRILETSNEADVISNILEMASHILRDSMSMIKTECKVVQHLLEKLGESITLRYIRSPNTYSMCFALSGYASLLKLNSPLLTYEDKIASIPSWIQGLKRLSIASQDFNTRYSVALAIKSFYQHCPRSENKFNVEGYCLEVNYILIHLLVDDDEDIRSLAASGVSDLLGRPMAPLAARAALLKFQVTNARQSSHFGWHCLHNLLVFNFSKSEHDPVDPEEMLQVASTVDYSLFAVEEPNLFSDPCSTLDLFGDAFLEFPFVSKLQNETHRSELHTLLKWASAGFAALERRHPVEANYRCPITKKSFNTSSIPVFTSIRRIIVCGKMAQVYWKKNLELISQFRKDSIEGEAVVDMWETYLLAINEGLATIPSRLGIHDSLRDFATRPLGV